MAMFHFIREITAAELKARATHYHKCFKHKLFFKPTDFCPGCGDLRPPLIGLGTRNDQQTAPGQIWPNTINVPYYPGQYRTTDGTTYTTPGGATFTMTMMGGGGGITPAGTIGYDESTGIMNVSDGTSIVNIGTPTAPVDRAQVDRHRELLEQLMKF